MNSHEQQQLVVFDGHDAIAFIDDDCIIIEGENYPYKVPIVDGLIAFLNLNLDEMDEVCWDEDFVEFPDHPYIEMFSPDFSAESEADFENVQEQCKAHFVYLKNLFFRLVTFCFDQNFYFEELGALTAYQRLYVYAKIPNGNVPQEITQLYLFDEAALEGFEETKKATPLEEAFNIPAGYVAHIKHTDAKMFTQYRLTSTYDALSLEFYQMLERNVKIKRCKNCDRYFLVKSKRNADYCDRLVAGTTQTCQQLAAVIKFAEKNKENRPYQIFTKYYKRYHERKKVGTIKADVFDKWNRQACTMRDECIDGKGDLKAFEQWCYDSFPNRPRKAHAK